MLCGKTISGIILDEVPNAGFVQSGWYKCFDCQYQGDMLVTVTEVEMDMPMHESKECPKCGSTQTSVLFVPEGVLLVDYGEVL